MLRNDIDKEGVDLESSLPHPCHDLHPRRFWLGLGHCGGSEQVCALLEGERSGVAIVTPIGEYKARIGPLRQRKHFAECLCSVWSVA